MSIGINEPAGIMFKKVMEVPDDLTIKYFELATDKHPDEIDKIKAELDNGANPRDIKLRLARIIVSLYHAPEDVKKQLSTMTKHLLKRESRTIYLRFSSIQVRLQ
jgi:tyrosyl-tRNA synthetase